MIENALAFPQVRLKWIDDGKVEFSLPSHRDLLTTIETVMGKEIAENLFLLEDTQESKSHWHLSGYLSHPSFTRGNRMGQDPFCQ